MIKRLHGLPQLIVALAILLLFPAVRLVAQTDGAMALLAQIEAYPHSKLVNTASIQVRDHEIGLGALQKVRGAWRFKDSERFTGELNRRTWQVLDGFSSAELFEQLAAKVEAFPGAEQLFDCRGRSCGHGSQWANRVFGQRVLYGRDDDQQYRVYRLAAGEEALLVIYASARTADRQYLHVDLLLVGPIEP